MISDSETLVYNFRSERSSVFFTDERIIRFDRKPIVRKNAPHIIPPGSGIIPSEKGNVILTFKIT